MPSSLYYEYCDPFFSGSLGMIPLLNNRLQSMPTDMAALEKAMLYRNMLNRMVIREGNSLADIARQMHDQLDLGSKPLLLYAADHSLEKLPGWKESQQSLLRLSTRSKLIVLPNTNHISMIQKYANMISLGIQELIEEISNPQKVNL